MSTDAIPSNSDDRFAFDQVLEFLGGDLNLLDELGKIYQEDYPILIEEIEGASNTTDAAAVRSSTHKLRGLVSNFRDTRLMETLSLVEKCASVGDLSESRKVMPFIKQRCAWLSNELMEVLSRAR